uniref:Ig-like domain-containing protein n=1 Tax=Myripristis murdjan TaxID=586833 RepID=A0A667YY34_9TELE
ILLYFIWFPAFLIVSGVAQFSDISQPVSFQTAKLGDPVTIECQIKSAERRNRVWYKLTAGRRLQCVATTEIFYDQMICGHQYHHHYSVKFDTIKTNLSISATTWEDIGTYYCGVQQLNFIEYGPGTFLMLKGTRSSSVSVVQQPESKSVQPGDSVTLSCSVHTGDCGGEDTSVFWLKNSESSGPEMIYFYGNRNDSCERTESGSPETSCVYKLPKQNLSSDDAGTYYCVVASCGETLFGNGTELHIEQNSTMTTHSDVSPVIIVLTLSTIVLGMATILLVWALRKSQSKDPTGTTNLSLASRSSSSWTAAVKRSQDAVLYSESST